MNELFHYGIPGQKWGVRRYQNKDGSLTAKGKKRYMILNQGKRALKTKDKMDRLYNTLSKEDKYFLFGDDKVDKKEWVSKEDSIYVVKRFMKEYGDTPVAALDIFATPKKDHLSVTIMTDPRYRRAGEASKLAKKGRDWFDKNADRLDVSVLEWGVYPGNTASIHLAEKTGFKYNKKASADNDYLVYEYKIKR